MKSQSIQRLSDTLCKISKLLNIVSRMKAGPSEHQRMGLFSYERSIFLLVHIHPRAFDKRMCTVVAGDKVV